MASSSPHLPERPEAAGEIETLLAEIPDWSDRLLVHMRTRYATGRLFRHGHDPEGALTGPTQRLLRAVDEEMARRGLEAQNEQG